MLHFGESIGVDMVALSFVRTAEDIEHVRRHTRLPLIAKIEKPQAVDAAEDIIRAADCVMVARGDLGIELPIEDVPIVQKQLLRTAGKLARPAITATQMLDSMVNSSRPTRAEVADVANAILDGTDAVMLSQETAIGAYPVEAVEMMASVAEKTEHTLPYRTWNEDRVRRDARDPAYTIAYSACAAARDLHLAALVVPTLSGRSARLISAHRPSVPIFALSPGKETVRRCNLMWGVQAGPMRRHEITEELIADAARRVVELGWVKPGARVGITAGLPSGRLGLAAAGACVRSGSGLGREGAGAALQVGEQRIGVVARGAQHQRECTLQRSARRQRRGCQLHVLERGAHRQPFQRLQERGPHDVVTELADGPADQD